MFQIFFYVITSFATSLTQFLALMFWRWSERT